MQKWLIGVDEAGRGPLAGPVAVGVALLPREFDWTLLPGVNDSKKLSEGKREDIFVRAKELKESNEIDFAVAMVGSAVIDVRGIRAAVSLAMARALRRLSVDPDDTYVKLDGLLQAPASFRFQETITGGDAKERVIGLASILAKVTRDRYMARKSNLAVFSPYDFCTHKGYGTKAHREAILRHGLSDLHRKSYCKNIGVL